MFGFWVVSMFVFILERFKLALLFRVGNNQCLMIKMMTIMRMKVIMKIMT